MLKHLSYSSLVLFTHNPKAWERKYIHNIREQRTSPAALTGSATHTYLELTLKGHPREVALDSAKREIAQATDVDWGKTGSAEKSIKELERFIDAWHSEYVVTGEVVDVEREFVHLIKGIKTPLLGYVDLVTSEGDALVVTDWKTVRALEDAPKPSHIVQAFFYKWLCEAIYGKKVIRCDFVQIKGSEGKEDPTRVKVLSVDYAAHPEWERGVKRLVQAGLREMNRKTKVFLPNLRDEYDGETSFNSWINT